MFVVGTPSGNRNLKNPVVGSATGNKPVSKIWVGSTGGNKMVWQRVPTLTLTATAVAWNGIDLSWTDMGPGATYNLFDNRQGPVVSGTAAESYQHRNLTGGLNYAYRVDAYIGGVKVAEAHANATTPAQPQPQYQQKSWTGAAVETASYTGSNALRGSNPLYYGYYSSNQGDQKSQARFAIPAEIRNCVSVDSVEIRWWNQHTWVNSGGQVSMVGHHNPSLGSWGGSTGVLLERDGSQVRWSAPKGGFINGTEWYHLGWLTSSGRYSIAEEIRVHGLQGFGLVAAVGGNNGYGYASADPQLRITYTVRTG
jgi:hypothetical protein